MKERSFSLLEVVLALGILSFCIAALLGLMPAGLEAHRWAANADGASALLEEIWGDIGAAVSGNKMQSSVFGLQLPRQGEALEIELLLDQRGHPAEPKSYQAYWRVKVRMRCAPTQSLVFGSVVVGWPSQAPVGGAEAFLAFERGRR